MVDKMNKSRVEWPFLKANSIDELANEQGVEPIANLDDIINTFPDLDIANDFSPIIYIEQLEARIFDLIRERDYCLDRMKQYVELDEKYADIDRLLQKTLCYRCLYSGELLCKASGLVIVCKINRQPESEDKCASYQRKPRYDEVYFKGVKWLDEQ